MERDENARWHLFRNHHASKNKRICTWGTIIKTHCWILLKYIHWIAAQKSQVLFIYLSPIIPKILSLFIRAVATPELPTCSFARSFDIQKYTRCYSQGLLNSEITTCYALLRRIARGLHRFTFNYTNHAWYQNMATLARKVRILSKHGRSPRRISDLCWPYYCRAVVTRANSTITRSLQTGKLTSLPCQLATSLVLGLLVKYVWQTSEAIFNTVEPL